MNNLDKSKGRGWKKNTWEAKAMISLACEIVFIVKSLFSSASLRVTEVLMVLPKVIDGDDETCSRTCGKAFGTSFLCFLLGGGVGTISTELASATTSISRQMAFVPSFWNSSATSDSWVLALSKFFFCSILVFASFRPRSLCCTLALSIPIHKTANETRYCQNK